MIPSEGHGLYLGGWQVAKGEDREVRFIPREKSDREGRGTSELKREIPQSWGGEPGRGVFQGRGRGGRPQSGADVTASGPHQARSPALPPPGCTPAGHTLHSARLSGSSGKTPPCECGYGCARPASSSLAPRALKPHIVSVPQGHLGC